MDSLTEIAPGRCWVPGCEAEHVFTANGTCARHNQLVADYRQWLGLAVTDGLISVTRDCDFDASRALLEILHGDG